MSLNQARSVIVDDPIMPGTVVSPQHQDRRDMGALCMWHLDGHGHGHA
jgi:hypothetical protein